MLNRASLAEPDQVWLFQGRLHLIPIFYNSPSNMPRKRRQLPGASQGSDDEKDGGIGSTEDDGFLAPSDALRVLRDTNSDTIAPEGIESIVWERIAG